MMTWKEIPIREQEGSGGVSLTADGRGITGED